jgi:predicted nucleic acid-binding protein
MDAAHISYWDAMIVGAAELSQCRWLLTEDLQDGRSFDTVTVINPFRLFPEEILGPGL